jgi:hypothetical protein
MPLLFSAWKLEKDSNHQCFMKIMIVAGESCRELETKYRRVTKCRL